MVSPVDSKELLFLEDRTVWIAFLIFKDCFAMIYLSTWMYEESEAEGGQYFQVGGDATSFKKKLIYWRCILLFFKLAHEHVRHRTDVQLCLFTNVVLLPNIDGIDLRSYLDSIGVKIIRLDYRWRPQFSSRAWYNQFYVFDILDYFEIHANEGDHFIVADSDCLAVDNLSPLLDTLTSSGHLTIDVETGPDDNINGISRRTAATLYGALGGTKQPLVAPYFGGEFFGISGQLLGPLLAISRDAFQINNRRAISGLPHLTEEAHLLSYSFVQIGIHSENSDRFVRRIWTTWKSNNTRQEDLDLLIWHVPSEKLFGIKTLASRIASAFRKGKTDPAFSKARLAYHLGVGQRRLTKIGWTLAYALMRRMRERFIRKR